ncbi:acetamidase [Coccidioides immitis RMSCC 2394]|uniref:amidase n=1 Tax=Coccidioides immitis RMSCC 2394 TaxID=404692 RepID=A0A0J6YGA1_COCIT|nr:acetamidase [Coccidioides immitis RMSCC 2394]
MTIADWQLKVQAKQVEVAAKIPKEWRLPSEITESISQDSKKSVIDVPRTCGLLTPRELEITENYDATDLLQKLASREFSSVEVTTAFAKRAAIAQQVTFCLTETFFDMALARAKELDDHLAKTGKTAGPFHGLPISLKETFNITGVPTTLGFVSFLDRPAATHDSALVQILLGAGAVLYCKTNVPQTMMTGDSHNNVFGRCLNPYSLNLSAGGSSGGEGALVAMRGSPLGVGTDIAGSIRIPALANGTYGFKPSIMRIPYAGQGSASRPGLTGVAPCAGPLTNSARDLELLLKVVFNSNAADLDDMALGTPWIEPTPKTTLTIGVIPEDPECPIHPPMQRTLKNAIQKLEAAGHKIVDLTGKFPSIADMKTVTMRYFNMDPDKTVFKAITSSGEPFIPSLKCTFDFSGTSPEPTLRELYDLNAAKMKYTAQIRAVYLDNKLDVLLGPAFQSCALPHDALEKPFYTIFANLVNYPASVIPFGRADKAADAAFVRQVQYDPPYLPDESEGAPCHVQLVTRTMQDEILLRYTLIVDKALKA